MPAQEVSLEEVFVNPVVFQDIPTYPLFVLRAVQAAVRGRAVVEYEAATDDGVYVVGLRMRLDGVTYRACGVAKWQAPDEWTRGKGKTLARRRARKTLVRMILDHENRVQGRGIVYFPEA